MSLSSAMLASISTSVSKFPVPFGFRLAYFHASSICHEKRADKFRSNYRGDGHKDYVRYVKKKRRAAEKRECLMWQSCAIHICNFEQIYWARGVNFCKSRKQGSSGRHNYYNSCFNSDAHFEPRSKKRSGQRSPRRDPFQTYWQTVKPSYTDWWGDFFNEDFSFYHTYNFRTARSSARGNSGTHEDTPGKEKAKVERRSVGSPSDRQTLGLSPHGSLTVEQLKKAFRASALKWHPDRHADAAKVTAEAKFKDCGSAYKSLLSALAKSC